MLWKILYIVGILSNLLPLIGAIYFYKKLDKLQFFLFLYAIGIVIGQVCDTFIVRVLHKDTVGFFEVYLIIQLVFSIWFFNKWKPFSKFYLILSIFFVVFICILEYFQYFINIGSYKNVSYTFPLIFIFFIVQSVVVILKTFDLSDTEFNKSYIFWIAFSNFIYFMIILPFNIYPFWGGELSVESAGIYNKIDTMINHIANVTLNSLILYSFKCRKS